MSHKVSIVILHWKNATDTIACLRSLKKCSYENFNILLVLNGTSYEDKISLHNSFDDWNKVEFIENEENLGFAEGNNVAIRKALKDEKLDYILALNNDTEVEPDFIEKALEKAEEGFGMVQILMHEHKNRKKIDCAGIKLTLSGLTFNINNLSDPAPIFCPSAGAALYSAKLLKDCALERQISSGFQSQIVKDYFDKDYFLYAEDFDLGFRALLRGYKPELAYKSVVYHKGSASSSTMSDLAVYHTYRNLLFTYIKCLPIYWIIILFSFIKIGYWAILIKTFTRKQSKVFFASLWDTWKYRKRMLKKRKSIQNNIKIKPKQLSPFISKRLFK